MEQENIKKNINTEKPKTEEGEVFSDVKKIQKPKQYICDCSHCWYSWFSFS